MRENLIQRRLTVRTQQQSKGWAAGGAQAHEVVPAGPGGSSRCGLPIWSGVPGTASRDIPLPNKRGFRILSLSPVQVSDRRKQSWSGHHVGKINCSDLLVRFFDREKNSEDSNYRLQRWTVKISSVCSRPKLGPGRIHFPKKEKKEKHHPTLSSTLYPLATPSVFLGSVSLLGLTIGS